MAHDPSGKTEHGAEASSAGIGWEDQSDSAEVMAALTERIGEQQRKVAASTHSRLNGRVDRGQHQKQLLGAFGALRIMDEIPDVLKHGPFVKNEISAAPLEYRVACRFSNGQPCPFSDKAADVRGIAIKFFSAQGTETDLLMTNEGGRSHARDAKQFMDFADVLVAQIEGGATGAFGVLQRELLERKLGLGETLRILSILAKEVQFHAVDSLTTERFWGSVVKLGAAAIKYSLQPHASTVSGTDAGTVRDDANYLRQDLLNRLKKSPIKWQLCVQLFVDEDSTPVHDASIAWKAALIPIGELEIRSRPSASDETLINQMAFNPGNGFEPLGITHARRDVYAASARNRNDRGLLSSAEARRHLSG